MELKDYIPCKIEETARTRVERGFGVLDSKNREVGGSVSLCVTTYTRDETRRPEQGGRVCTPGSLGVWYTARPHALRDGQPFGAIQGAQSFRTEAERDAYVARYFANAQKRARKAANRT